VNDPESEHRILLLLLRSLLTTVICREFAGKQSRATNLADRLRCRRMGKITIPLHTHFHELVTVIVTVKRFIQLINQLLFD